MPNHISLFQLNSLIRNTLDKHLDPSLLGRSEIGEIRMAQKGHCYLELVEKEDENLCAKIKANIWAYTYRNICGWFESITGKSLRPGMKILAQVAVSYHEIYGISLNVKDIDPNFTLGERAIRRQQVINRLKEEGVFDMNRELHLPMAPQRIAVISSPSAAGYEDFMMHLQNNPYRFKFDVTLYKSMMQGVEAQTSIIKSLHEIHRNLEKFDLLVIIRGGGAQVDLDCFDTYDLASHIAQFPLPVITGIGHERDETILDLVAHTRMKTPTAVAEFLLGGLRAFDEKLSQLYKRLQGFSSFYIKEHNYILSDLAHKLRFNSKNLFSENKHKLTKLHSEVDFFCKSQIRSRHTQVQDLKEMLILKIDNKLKDENLALKNLENNIKLLDPENVLKRGYTITKVKGLNISIVDSLHPGDVITTETVDRVIISRLQEFDKKNLE